MATLLGAEAAMAEQERGELLAEQSALAALAGYQADLAACLHAATSHFAAGPADSPAEVLRLLREVAQKQPAALCAAATAGGTAEEVLQLLHAATQQQPGAPCTSAGTSSGGGSGTGSCEQSSPGAAASSGRRSSGRSSSTAAGGTMCGGSGSSSSSGDNDADLAKLLLKETGPRTCVLAWDIVARAGPETPRWLFWCVPWAVARKRGEAVWRGSVATVRCRHRLLAPPAPCPPALHAGCRSRQYACCRRRT